MTHRLTSFVILLALAVAGPARAQTPAPLWSAAQIERLIQWMDFARGDALLVANTEEPKLRAAQARGDAAELDRVATSAAVQLLDGYYQGCCDASLRSGWHIAGDRPKGDPAALVTEAVRQGATDPLFIAAAPRHPFYRALRKAFATETDPVRKATLAANMDRWRWMPRDLGRRYLLVNTAAFEATLWADGAQTGRWAVIVGKTKSPTPIFSARVTGVVLNPWWEIPSSIAAEGIAATVARNPAAAARRGYVYENGRYRQRPGPNNSLGRMKLVMPNPYNVYLHDTPAQALFGQEVRAYSHGCVRVGDALDLATTLLSGNGDWDRARVDAVVASGETRTVTLNEALPVYVAYFTAEPDDDGSMRFFPDVYKRDRAALSPPGGGEACGVQAGVK